MNHVVAVRQWYDQEHVNGLDRILNLPIKNSINEIGNDDSIRIFQWDEINEFITINSMLNSLVEFQTVFLN
jgi:hypothetical protein